MFEQDCEKVVFVEIVKVITTHKPKKKLLSWSENSIDLQNINTRLGKHGKMQDYIGLQRGVGSGRNSNLRKKEIFVIPYF